MRVSQFNNVLNRPPPTTEGDIQDTDLMLKTSQREEIMAASRFFKNRKNPDQDKQNADLFKVDPEIAAEVLQPLFEAIWDKKQLPDDLMEGTIVKIQKGCSGQQLGRNNHPIGVKRGSCKDHHQANLKRTTFET